MRGARLHQLALVPGILGYSLLVHYSNLGTAPAALGAALAIAPLLTAPALWAWRSRWRWWALPLLLAAAGAAVWGSWSRIERHFDWIYLWQQCALYAALALLFGRTLLPGQISLCTRWATLVHGELPQNAVRYTRAVTAVWTAFFIAVVVASVALYAFSARATWSLFSNFLILPLAVLLFMAEYLLRRRALPHMPRATLHEMAQLYAAESQALSRRPPSS